MTQNKQQLELEIKELKSVAWNPAAAFREGERDELRQEIKRLEAIYDTLPDEPAKSPDFQKVGNYKQGSPEWHAARSKGLGGSDMAAVMGLNPYKTPFMLWQEKTGKAVNNIDSEKMQIGRDIEDFCAAQYTKRTGTKTRKSNKFKVHKDYPFIGGSVDRLFKSEQGLGVLEMKNVSNESFKNTFSGGIPDYYFIQIQTYLFVFGAQIAHLWVFVGGDHFELFTVIRNEAVIESIIKSADRFWNVNVKMNIAPPLMNLDDAKLKFPPENVQMGSTMPANMDIYADCVRLAEIKAEIKTLEQEEEKIKMDVLQWMGDSELLINDDGKPIATWKPQLRTSFDSKAFKAENPDLYKQFEKTTESRVFLLKLKSE